MTTGTLHGSDVDGNPIEVRATRTSVDDRGEWVDVYEPFVQLDALSHLFVPGEARRIHPAMFTFIPDEEASDG